MNEWNEPGASAAPVAQDCGCDEAVSELWAYLDSELEGPEAERVKQHLEGCVGCLDEHDVELVVKKLVRRCYSQDESAPDELRAKIRAHIVTLQVRTTIVERSS
ncbi:mycothiol system anti-sigma-R factor [Cellulomonas rhizosphaerae]|uniref:Mycothiol system anti-sigma-R factor n=1 Tax=Cellulomonas rhizosphaerae TaxID=2293719 RepID=A0A413RN52_9CELL|nr:mycothiol system anti-sigma-R factor [Cellulomonas rhizosphaerae]RHA42723.1 mycothiol system anti-sigma-R factor [Cellulomonas rhizosphaerae]